VEKEDLLMQEIAEINLSINASRDWKERLEERSKLDC